MSSVQRMLRALRKLNHGVLALEPALKDKSTGEGALPERFQLVRARVECARQELESAIKLLELPL